MASFLERFVLGCDRYGVVKPFLIINVRLMQDLNKQTEQPEN